MRKSLLLVILVFVLVLAGCGSNLSEIGREIGEEAISIIDSFLDGEITGNTAHAMILELNYFGRLDADYRDDRTLRSRLIIIENAILIDTDDARNNIIQARNGIAGVLGLDSR